MQEIVTIRGTANDLSFGVNPSAAAASVPINRAKIQNLAVFPAGRIMNSGRRQVARTGNDACLVDPDRFRIVAAKCAKIVHLSITPKESVKCGITRKVRDSNDFVPAVGTLCEANRSTKGPEIRHLSVIPQERIQGRNPRIRIRRRTGGRVSLNHSFRRMATTDKGKHVIAAQSSNVDLLAVLPKKSVRWNSAETDRIWIEADS